MRPTDKDVHSANTKIFLRNRGKNWAQGKCIVVYDEIYGRFRLTEKLYLKFRHVLDRLQAATDSDFEEDANLKTAVALVCDEVSTFDSGETEGDGAIAFPDDPQSPSLSQDYVRVFAEGSIVCWRQERQMAVDVKIMEPIVDPEMSDGEILYRIEVSRKLGLARQLVRAFWIEPSADTNHGVADVWSRRQIMKRAENPQRRPIKKKRRIRGFFGTFSKRLRLPRNEKNNWLF